MIAAVLLACAAHVSPITLQAIVQHESGGNPIAIHVNHRNEQPVAASMEDAIRITEDLVARGESVDMGLMQITSANLPALGLTVRQVFDPCTNIRAGASILAADYHEAVKSYGEGQGALKAALSAYNTGNFSAGFLNGYVRGYYSGAIATTVTVVKPSRAMAPPNPPAILAPYSAATEVYTRVSFNVRID